MSKTILIVEDNELNMKLFNDLLQARGYDTLQARDGRDVINMARKHRPALILMDIQLPGLSGLEVTKLIKSDDDLRETPVIAVTAFAMKGDENKIREGGCDAYIAKTHFRGGLPGNGDPVSELALSPHLGKWVENVGKWGQSLFIRRR